MLMLRNLRLTHLSCCNVFFQRSSFNWAQAPIFSMEGFFNCFEFYMRLDAISQLSYVTLVFTIRSSAHSAFRLLSFWNGFHWFYFELQVNIIRFFTILKLDIKLKVSAMKLRIQRMKQVSDSRKIANCTFRSTVFSSKCTFSPLHTYIYINSQKILKD